MAVKPVILPRPQPVPVFVKPAGSKPRSDAPGDYWRTKRKPFAFGREQFRLYRRRRGVSVMRIDDLVTGFGWEDTDTILRGSLQTNGAGPKGWLAEGDVIECMVDTYGSGKFVALWSMDVWAIDRSLVGAELQATLADPLERLNVSTDDFRYVRNKAHPKGWLVHEIVLDIAKRYGMSVGAMPKTTHRVLNFTTLNTSPLSAIIDLFKRERTATGHRYFMRMYRGKLWVTPLRRSALLLEMGPTILDGHIATSRKDAFATVLTVRGTAAKDASASKAKRKIEAEVRSNRVVARYGVVHRILAVPDADSESELRKKGKAKLLEGLKPLREFSFSHPGIPGVRRGQALRIALSDFGLSQIVFVSSVTHSVSPGGYAMDVSVIFTDPYVDTQAVKNAAAKRAAAAKAGTKTEAGPAKANPSARVRPATYQVRRDAA